MPNKLNENVYIVNETVNFVYKSEHRVHHLDQSMIDLPNIDPRLPQPMNETIRTRAETAHFVQGVSIIVHDPIYSLNEMNLFVLCSG